MKLRCKPELF